MKANIYSRSRSGITVMVIFALLFSPIISPLSAAEQSSSFQSSVLEGSSNSSQDEDVTVQTNKAGGDERGLVERGVRFGLAFTATTAIKGLFGMAPGYLPTFLPSLAPSLFVPALIGVGMLEGIISLSVYSAITGVKDRKWLVRSFLLASVVSVTASFFLTGLMAPWAVTLISNSLRLLVFTMLTRPPDKSVTDHLVDEVKEVVGVDDEQSESGDTGASAPVEALTVAEIQELRLKAYSNYVNASNSSERTGFYNDFKYYSTQLLKVKEQVDYSESN